MTYFSFHFLLCNAIICIFLGILLGLKRLLQNQLSARMQYNLSIIFQTVDKALLLQGFAIVGTAFLI